MNRRWIRLSLASCLITLSGCGTVTFKPGASPGAMAEDESACRSAAAAAQQDAAFVDCMRRRGWFVSGAKPMQSAPAAAAVDSADVSASGPASKVPPAVAERTVAPSASDPLARLAVASWWKRGGSGADLARSLDACAAQLGPAHRAAPDGREVTHAMRDCLRADGWYAIGTSDAH